MTRNDNKTLKMTRKGIKIFVEMTRKYNKTFEMTRNDNKTLEMIRKGNKTFEMTRKVTKHLK